MSGLGALGGALKVGAVLAALSTYMRVTDELKAANAQLKLATRTQSDLNRESQKAYEIAQRNGTAFNETATLLAKNLKAANSIGIVGVEAAQKAEAATASVSAAIRVSGTSSEAAKGSLIQLGQALASGVLRGDELNSVMEGIPAVADALAKSMGKSTAELRKMGAAGKLTSGAVLEGLAKAQPELERLASMIPLTFSAAFQKVKNAGANLLGKFDQGTSFSAGIIAAVDGASRVLDSLGRNAQLVSNVVVGALVAMAAGAARSFAVSAAATTADVTAKLVAIRETQALAVAEAELAAATVVRARAQVAGGGGSAVKVGAAVADAGLAAAKVAAIGAEAAAAEVALAKAAAGSTLFGRALVLASTAGRAALALIGGPIGLAIAGLVALGLWAAKAAASFQPIAGEAGTVSDYVAVAFEDATKWVSDKFTTMSVWVGQRLNDVGGYVRPVAAFIVDAFLNVGRSVAGVVGGIVEAWRAGVGNIGKLIGGIQSDAASLMKGNPTTAGVTAALGSSVSIGAAFGKGMQSGFDGTFKGVTGDKVVGAAVDFVKSIPGRISDLAKSSGYRDRANQRAADRAKMQAGGLGDPGKPPVPESDKDKAKKDKAHKETFADILKVAREEAQAASLTTAERERQQAVIQAQKTLKRDLSDLEATQLRSAVQLRQTNEANLALDNGRLDAAEAMVKARAEAAAEAMRDAGNLGGAAQITAELAVQERVNQAKRDGLTLDAGKLESYRQAVLLASQEGEQIKAQAEARRQLRAIADEARNSIREAISGGIFDALSGKLSVGGLFKTFGNILKKQFAEQVTYAVFQGGADQSQVTAQAVSLVTPAANALAQATSLVTASMGGGTSGAAANDNNPIATATADGARQVQAATSQLSGVLGGAVAPMSEAIRGILGLFGLVGKGTLMGGGNSAPTTGIGKFFGASGPVSKGLDKVANLIGVKGKDGVSGGSRLLGKAASGLAIGAASGQVLGMLGVKTSSTGSSLGGMAGSLIAGPLGAAIGGALGGILGGLFKKTAKSSATITSVDGPVNATGSSKALRTQATSLGGSVQQGLRDIAKTLNATVGAFNVSIGTYKDDLRVNENGKALGGVKNSGALSFGEDTAAAVSAAIELAIKQGAIKGLSAGISEALRNGSATVQEVADFAATKKEVDNKAKAVTDPIGAALDTLDDQFNTMREQYKKFGEDTTNLEKYYQDQRSKVIAESTKNELAGIRAFRDELRGGDLGNKSLGEQASFQSAAFGALEQARAQGKGVDYDQVNTIGRALLDATRQLEGNTPAYTAQVDRVMGLLNGLIGDNGAANVSPLSPVVDTSGIITATDATTAAVNAQTNALLAGINNVGAAVVRMNAQVTSKLDGLGSGGYDGASADNFTLRNFA